MSEKPAFVYIARKNCGCCVGLVGDEADKPTAKCVADFIKSGLHVERVSWQDYEQKIRFEPTFFSCSHEAAEKKASAQLVLF